MAEVPVSVATSAPAASYFYDAASFDQRVTAAFYETATEPTDAQIESLLGRLHPYLASRLRFSLDNIQDAKMRQFLVSSMQSEANAMTLDRLRHDDSLLDFVSATTTKAVGDPKIAETFFEKKERWHSSAKKPKGKVTKKREQFRERCLAPSGPLPYHHTASNGIFLIEGRLYLILESFFRPYYGDWEWHLRRPSKSAVLLSSLLLGRTEAEIKTAFSINNLTELRQKVTAATLRTAVVVASAPDSVATKLTSSKGRVCLFESTTAALNILAPHLVANRPIKRGDFPSRIGVASVTEATRECISQWRTRVTADGNPVPMLKRYQLETVYAALIEMLPGFLDDLKCSTPNIFSQLTNPHRGATMIIGASMGLGKSLIVTTILDVVQRIFNGNALLIIALELNNADLMQKEIGKYFVDKHRAINIDGEGVSDPFSGNIAGQQLSWIVNSDGSLNYDVISVTHGSLSAVVHKLNAILPPNIQFVVAIDEAADYINSIELTRFFERCHLGFRTECAQSPRIVGCFPMTGTLISTDESTSSWIQTCYGAEARKHIEQLIDAAAGKDKSLKSSLWKQYAYPLLRPKVTFHSRALLAQTSDPLPPCTVSIQLVKHSPKTIDAFDKFRIFKETNPEKTKRSSLQLTVGRDAYCTPHQFNLVWGFSVEVLKKFACMESDARERSAFCLAFHIELPNNVVRSEASNKLSAVLHLSSSRLYKSTVMWIVRHIISSARTKMDFTQAPLHSSIRDRILRGVACCDSDIEDLNSALAAVVDLANHLKAHPIKHYDASKHSKTFAIFVEKNLTMVWMGLVLRYLGLHFTGFDGDASATARLQALHHLNFTPWMDLGIFTLKVACTGMDLSKAHHILCCLGSNARRRRQAKDREHRPGQINASTFEMIGGRDPYFAAKLRGLIVSDFSQTGFYMDPFATDPPQLGPFSRNLMLQDGDSVFQGSEVMEVVAKAAHGLGLCPSVNSAIIPGNLYTYKAPGDFDGFATAVSAAQLPQSLVSTSLALHAPQRGPAHIFATRQPTFRSKIVGPMSQAQPVRPVVDGNVERLAPPSPTVQSDEYILNGLLLLFNSDRVSIRQYLEAKGVDLSNPNAVAAACAPLFSFKQD